MVLSLDDARVRETQCYPVRFSLNSHIFGAILADVPQNEIKSIDVENIV